MSKELAKKMNVSLDFVTEKDKKIGQFLVLADETKIENEEGYEIARGNIKQMKDVLKEIEEERKKNTEPFRNLVKYVNDTCKYYTSKIEDALSTMNSKVVGYSNIVAAQKEAEEKARLENARKEAEAKEGAAEKFLRIRLKMYSFLVGGAWIEKDGTQRTKDGCSSSEEVNKLHRQVESTFPPASEFGHLAKESRTLIATFSARCATLMSIYQAKLDPEDEKERIAALKREIVEENNEIANNLGIEIEKEIKKEEKEIKREIHSVSKGIRKTIRFSVTEESEVPRSFMTVDDKKVNEFIRVKRDKILESLKKNHQPIKGIKFYVEQKAL